MKEIPGLEGYAVDARGNVYSLKSRWGPRTTPKQLCQRTDRDGYCRVELYAGGRKRKYLVHRLVLKTFVGPCPVGLVCRHLNGNPADNRIENLAWGTYKENESDKLRHGTRRIAEQLPWTKLTTAEVKQICNRLSDGDTPTQIAGDYGVTATTICDIKHRRSWRHLLWR